MKTRVTAAVAGFALSGVAIATDSNRNFVSEFDLDDSGFIEIEEAIGNDALSANFPLIDADLDSRISEEELNEFLAQDQVTAYPPEQSS